MTDLAVRGDTPPVLQVPIGLLLSIGDTVTKDGKTYPVRLDHFRAKPGALDQYQDAAAKFADTYGPEPKRLTDVYFMADEPEAVLDVRLLAFSKSGLRLRGHTNYAAISDPEEFRVRAFSFEDTITYYPRTAGEVKADMRADWQGEPIEGKLTGWDDPRVEKLGVRVVANLSFLLPEILGVGMRVVLSTGGRRSIRNFHAGVWAQYMAFRGLLGRPFRLTVRPAKTQRFDSEKRAYVATTFQELVLDTPQTVVEIMSELRRVKATLGPARAGVAVARGMIEAEAQVLAGALDLPTVDVAVFDEVEDLTAEGEVVGESGSGETPATGAAEPEAGASPAGRSDSPQLFQPPSPEVEARREENIRRRMETGE